MMWNIERQKKKREFPMKNIQKIFCIIIVFLIIIFFAACDFDGYLEIVNHYHEPITRFGLGDTMHKVNIPEGGSYIYPVSNRHQVFVITNDNKASNSVGFYADTGETVIITLNADGTLTLNLYSIDADRH
jgi:hypothetical protein